MEIGRQATTFHQTCATASDRLGDGEAGGAEGVGVGGDPGVAEAAAFAHGDADRRGHVLGGEGIVHSVEQEGGAGGVALDCEHAELVAAQAGDQVHGAGDTDQGLRGAAEELVTGAPAVAIVDCLETVDVEDQHRGRRTGPPAALLLAGHAAVPRPAITDAGERVDRRLFLGPAQPGLQVDDLPCLDRQLLRRDGLRCFQLPVTHGPSMRCATGRHHGPTGSSSLVPTRHDAENLTPASGWWEHRAVIGIGEEHEALQHAARRFLDERCPASVPRALLDNAPETLPPFWDDVVALGWLGLHVAEEHGGQGYGLAELAIVLEELGRACAPGPFLPTALAAAVIAEAGTDELRAAYLPQWCGGRPAAIAFNGSFVLGGGLAQDVVVAVGADEWAVVAASDLTVTAMPNLDETRRVHAVEVGDPARIPVAPRFRCDAQRVRDLAAVLLAAECAGGAAWCLDTASSYAKVREQFGRPIGQFQGVKHRAADMLVAVEQAVCAAWDAARAGDDEEGAALAAAVAGAVAPEVFARCAKDCIQILGGIGFTWEHDAHLYLRRAMAVRQLLGGAGPPRARTAALAASGVRRRLAVDLPAEADAHRAEVQAFADQVRDLPGDEQRRRVVDAGYFVPHWPEPWGRDAGPLEQLVIDDELRAAKIRRPNLAIGAWAAPTIVAHGTPEQCERWVRPTLYGELAWCQMFSEPGAGSDLAALSTKATRVDGGWSLSGQKVWTTMARDADWAICLARTNPAAPKHLGITYFILDMKAEGLDIRPLRELTGHAMFNEIFLSDVFVPDDCVVGEVDGGWPLARTTLANERVAMAQGSSFGGGMEALLALAAERELAGDALTEDALGGLLAEAQTIALLGLRTTLRALTGARPGPESSVRKLLSVEHDQRVQEQGLAMLGPAGATTDGPAAQWAYGFLANRCLTIAGGTSEVQRNVIAERLLGLPRD
jgi:3-oxochol-4-en-24-oyl-CoA dehydrogenase